MFVAGGISGSGKESVGLSDRYAFQNHFLFRYTHAGGARRNTFDVRLCPSSNVSVIFCAIFCDPGFRFTFMMSICPFGSLVLWNPGSGCSTIEAVVYESTVVSVTL